MFKYFYKTVKDFFFSKDIVYPLWPEVMILIKVVVNLSVFFLKNEIKLILICLAAFYMDHSLYIDPESNPRYPQGVYEEVKALLLVVFVMFMVVRFSFIKQEKRPRNIEEFFFSFVFYTSAVSSLIVMYGIPHALPAWETLGWIGYFSVAFFMSSIPLREQLHKDPDSIEILNLNYWFKANFIAGFLFFIFYNTLQEIVGVTILLTKQAFTFSDNFFWFSSDVSFFVGLGLNSILFSIFIFLIGGFGIIFNRKDILWLMVSIEIMFLGISLVFIFTFVFFDTPLSIIYSFIIVSLAAAEAAIGFGLLVGSFSLRPNISFSRFNHLKG